MLNKFLLSLLVLSSMGYAQFNISSIHDAKALIDLGYFNAKEGRPQHINMSDLYGNDYTLNATNQQNFLVGAGLFVPSSLQDIDLGLHVYYFNTTGVSGTIVQEGYYTNLAYNYNVINTPIYLSAQKEIHYSKFPTTFLIHAGLGPNIVSLYNYSETPLNNFSLSSHTFTSSSKTQFSANAGFGIQLSKQFELSYQFFYLGQSQLRPQNNGVLNALQTTNMYANTLVLSLII